MIKNELPRKNLLKNVCMNTHTLECMYTVQKLPLVYTFKKKKIT